MDGRPDRATDRVVNRVALVTGGGSEIGRATALAFARKGARVAVCDGRLREAEQTARLIRRSGGQAIPLKVDVTQTREVEAMVRRTLEVYGRLDYAFNAASVTGMEAATAEYPEEAWNQVVGVNLTGVWLCMKYELRPMLRQGSGAIVNLCSVLGLAGMAYAPAYVAAKLGVIGLTKTAAREYAARGVRVNAVCPGTVDRPMLERAALLDGLIDDRQWHEDVLALHPLRRLEVPEADEVAEGVLWLCSQAAAPVNGEAMLVDGGDVAHLLQTDAAAWLVGERKPYAELPIA